MLSQSKFIDPLARLLIAAIFLLSGLGKFAASSQMAGYMAAFGVPGALVWPAAAFEVGSALLLLAGLYTRPVALLLTGFTVLTALIFHRDFADQTQTIMFLKNLAMAGGLLLVVRDGARHLSVDAVLAKNGASV
jgi:putative oxidoreductase